MALQNCELSIRKNRSLKQKIKNQNDIKVKISIIFLDTRCFRYDSPFSFLIELRALAKTYAASENPKSRVELYDLEKFNVDGKDVTMAKLRAALTSILAKLRGLLKTLRFEESNTRNWSAMIQENAGNHAVGFTGIKNSINEILTRLHQNPNLCKELSFSFFFFFFLSLSFKRNHQIILYLCLFFFFFFFVCLFVSLKVLNIWNKEQIQFSGENKKFRILFETVGNS